MQKVLIVLLLFILPGCSQTKVPVILAEDYSFLLTDGEVTKIRQANDTLYEFKCYIDQPCYFKPVWRYKIIDIRKSADVTIFKVESLDTVPLAEDFCPGKRFGIIALKNIDRNQFGHMGPFPCLTRRQLDTIQINSLSLNDRTFLTYFSDTYLKELSALKRISTKDDVKEVIDAIRDNNFNAGRISYSAEELNKACIEKGYNPVGAGLTIASLLK